MKQYELKWAISLCVLKENTILDTVMLKARGPGTWPEQRRKPSTKNKATHK